MDDEFFNSLNAQTREFAEFENLLNTFAEDLVDALATLSEHHFCSSSQGTGFVTPFNADKKIIKKVMQSAEYIKIYSYMMCKEIQQIISDFADEDLPKGKALKYCKKEYPEYDEIWAEQQLHNLLLESKIIMPQDRVALRKRIEKERAAKAFYQEYEKAIHRELKKLVLKHCPHITTISGNGLRQIDYMLQEYMFKISASLRKLLADS